MESFKRGLTSDPKVSSSVDWLTEVIRRYSEAALAAKSMFSVNMKTITRQEQASKFFVKDFCYSLTSAF